MSIMLAASGDLYATLHIHKELCCGRRGWQVGGIAEAEKRRWLVGKGVGEEGVDPVGLNSNMEAATGLQVAAQVAD
jgi:hypothetical protein